MADVAFKAYAGKRGPERQVTGMQLLGAPELASVLASLGERTPTVFALALNKIANDMMKDAKKRTPVDTGALRASGHVQRPVIDRTMVSVTLGFGGDQSIGGTTRQGKRIPQNYAVYVHEDLTKRHPVGEAKFLENAMLAKAPTMEQQLASILRDEVARAAR